MPSKVLLNLDQDPSADPIMVLLQRLLQYQTLPVSLSSNKCRPAQILHCLLPSRGLLLCRDLFEETDSIDSAAVAPPSRLARGGKSAYKLNSVGARFRKQLHGLMGTLNQCQPHYIRSVSHTGWLLWESSIGELFRRPSVADLVSQT